MKLFKVWVDKVDYETYDSFVCVANSEEEIRSRIIDNCHGDNVVHMEVDDDYENSVRFEIKQGEIHIKEVNLDVDEPYVVCSSYNAG